MTTQEFSNEFDVLYNNIMSNQAPGLNEYEKSVFLTKAQYEIVKNYCNPKGNKYQEGVDGSPKRQIDFSTLLRVEKISPMTLNSDSPKFDNRSVAFVYPSKAWIPINESITTDSKTYQIIPLSYNEYLRLMSKPYKYPLKNQAWRLFNRSSTYLTPGRKECEFIANGKFKITIINKGIKDIHFTFKSSDSATIETNTTFSETADFYNIEFTIPVNVHSSNWWNAHLLNETSLWNDADRSVNKLTGPWNGSSNSSSFPAFIPRFADTYVTAVVPAAHTSYDTTICEIIGAFNSETPTYKVRYFTKPTPIITYDLNPEGTPEKDKVFIEGEENRLECILPDELHPEILQRAVELAKAAFQGDLNSTIELGKRSE